MRLFKNLPIKRKLMLIGLVTNGVAVILLSATFGAVEWTSYRNRAVTTLSVHAGITADNAASALIFADEKAAQEVLARLGAETNIVYAALQEKNGDVIARFEAPGRRKMPAAMLASDEHLFFLDQLAYAKNVVHSGETVGVLYLQSDLQGVYWELFRKLLLIAATMILSLAFAIFLFARFQKTISDPIRNLVEAMARVTRQNDYLARVPVNSRDEFGVLAEGFNTMLAAVREREEALAEYRKGLEATVRLRTAELEDTNQGLRQQIEERVRMEQALKLSETGLAEAQRIAHIGNWEWDVASGALHWSDEVYRIFGYSPGEVQPNYEFHLQRMHPDDIRLLERMAQQALSDCLPKILDYRILLPNGGERTVHLQGEVILGEAGKPVRMVGTVQDITEFKKLERELRRLNETLEQRVAEEAAKSREKDHLLIQQSRLAAIGEMIGNIAHQWRQPINALTLLLGNIKDAYEHNELGRDYLDKSVQEGQTIIQRMSATIDDFRNFFRPNKEKASFSVNDAVADALRILEAAFKNSSIAVFVKGDENVMACGYRNEYSQILINILGNASDVFQERKVTDRRVHITISRRDALSEVTVEDNAGGIPSDILPRIFDPYFTTKEKGTGIGLYMSKMIIENSMGGHIEASNIGDGARFTLTTPSGAA